MRQAESPFPTNRADGARRQVHRDLHVTEAAPRTDRPGTLSSRCADEPTILTEVCALGFHRSSVARKRRGHEFTGR